jgi:hypothetical protein
MEETVKYQNTSGFRFDVDEKTKKITINSNDHVLLVNEISDRKKADAAMQAAIDAEVQARAGRDNDLQEQIDAEAQNRERVDGGLQEQIDAETETRGDADETLQDNIDALKRESEDKYQLYDNLVTEWQETPDNTHYPSERLVKDEIDAVRAITVTGLRYMGTLDYGADTVASMDGIPSPADGATCGVAETNLTYIYDGAQSVWTAQPHGTDTDGDMWRMASWYGTWQGQTFTGNATADIVCRDASDPANPVWDLLVSESTPVDGVTIGSINGKNGVLDGGITAAKLADSYISVIKVNGAAL